MDVCSSHQSEPLPGTAKKGDVYVLVEHTGSWSHDILDGGTFSPELTEQLAALPGLYLIRKPGTNGRPITGERRAYIVFGSEGLVERHTVAALEDVLKFDLSGPGRKGVPATSDPVLLVCTHAKRDRCCAVKGRPAARALHEAYPDVDIWECSHAKGHRFAPALVLFPYGYAYGRLTPEQVIDLWEAATAGRLYLPGLRGRGTLSPLEQAAEVAVVQELLEDVSPGALHVQEGVVTHPDGRSWQVELHQELVPDVVASCGKPPKAAKAWVVDAVRAVSR